MKHFSLLKHLEAILKKHNSRIKSSVTLNSNTSANPTRIQQCTTISKKHVTSILFNNYANHSEFITKSQLMHIGNNNNVNNNHNCKGKNTKSVATLSIPSSDYARILVLCVQYKQWCTRHDERQAQHNDWKRSPTVENPSAYAMHCKVSKVSVYPNHWCFGDGSLLSFACVSQPCRPQSPVISSTSKSKIKNMLAVLGRVWWVKKRGRVDSLCSCH